MRDDKRRVCQQLYAVLHRSTSPPKTQHVTGHREQRRWHRAPQRGPGAVCTSLQTIWQWCQVLTCCAAIKWSRHKRHADVARNSRQTANFGDQTCPVLGHINAESHDRQSSWDNANWCKWMKEFQLSQTWLKGKMTGKPCFWHLFTRVSGEIPLITRLNVAT